MKIILKSLFLLFLFIYLLWIFIPKENIYFWVLEELQEHKVEIDSSSVQDTNIGLQLSNSTIIYEGIQVASIPEISFSSLIFTTNIKLENIKIQKALKNFLPLNLKYMSIKHTLLDPFALNIELPNDYKIHNKQIMKHLTKTKDGYRYEYKF